MVCYPDFDTSFFSSFVGILETDSSLSIFLRKLLIPSLKHVQLKIVLFSVLTTTWQTNSAFNMDVNVVILHCLLVQVMYPLSCSISRILLHMMQHFFFFTSIPIRSFNNVMI